VYQEHNLGCQLPTKDNPFMNVPFYELGTNKELLNRVLPMIIREFREK